VYSVASDFTVKHHHYHMIRICYHSNITNDFLCQYLMNVRVLISQNFSRETIPLFNNPQYIYLHIQRLSKAMLSYLLIPVHNVGVSILE